MKLLHNIQILICSLLFCSIVHTTMALHSWMLQGMTAQVEMAETGENEQYPKLYSGPKTLMRRFGYTSYWFQSQSDYWLIRDLPLNATAWPVPRCDGSEFRGQLHVPCIQNNNKPVCTHLCICSFPSSSPLHHIHPKPLDFVLKRRKRSNWKRGKATKASGRCTC